MATDFLLLQRYPAGSDARFRHYGWSRPAFTFGYSQKIDFVRQQIGAAADEGVANELCRRPTGGGIVDHRDDWTYSLVIPRGHALEEQRAAHSYRAIHEAVAEGLAAQGVAAEIKQSLEEEGAAAEPGVCFQRAEVYDVIHRETGRKIAGAAQKRNKHGLLFQGSIWRPATEHPRLDWDKFELEFVQRLAAALSLAADPTPWPDLNEDEVAALIEQYGSPEWLEFR